MAVADDDELVRGLVRTILTLHGYRVTLLAGAEEVLQGIGREAWSLLIIDLHMPRRSGLEVIREIRRQGWSLPAILMSGLLTEDVVEECRRLDVECLPKPFEVDQLVQTVSRSLS